ncbi:MAG: hypothetical protein A2275_07350 [Bacteroidetes bacterium RIFOXYA12_FULL_35_11]|nr:MAG: hypothetical protein A2X01_06440 [Bacteroidetes bacterium GWF2_35_48]OFY73064.1 MAG: hypothetical protein A2275_07350 [Bacteroidetes bacterium RIFOXYA12_FULL_35_11]OFY94634.1 MAG: hypothetical protein A2491_08970 [Bacteroidetes bacterium RIFOXYC12_FULL_35_7]HBX53538.1 hypothetical protein [Bacteroidales bacterium]
MNVFFRVDASPTIGYGHLVRSLAVADGIRSKHLTSNFLFIVNSFSKAIEKIHQLNFKTIVVPDKDNEETFLNLFFQNQELSIIVFDNMNKYSFSFIENLKKNNKVVMVHSYSEGRYLADLAIYPAAHLPEDFIIDKNWTKHKTNFLHGLDYVLLNKNILETEKKKIVAEPPKKIVFIAGGSDPSNSLLTFYDWCRESNFDQNFQFYLLYGQACCYINEIKNYPENSHLHFLPFSVDFIKDADIAVCAFGVTLYELVYLNIPTISYGHTLLHAEASKRFAEKYNCTVNMGLLSMLDCQSFKHTLEILIEDFQKRNDLFIKSKGLIDGNGINRFVENIELLMHANVSQ